MMEGGRLLDLDIIELREKGIASNIDMNTNGSNERLTNGNCRSSNGKVVDLTADIDLVVLEETAIEVAFMRGSGEAKTIDEDVVGEFLKQFTGFRVTLECMLGMNNHTTWDVDIETCMIPIGVGVINTNVGGNGRSSRVGIGITCVGEKNVEVADSSNGKE